MQSPIDPDAVANSAQSGAVLAVVSLSLAPLTILVARRIFPGRNVVFARWGFSHLFYVMLFGLALLWLSQSLWPTRTDPIDVQVEMVRMAAVLAAVVALIARFAHTLDPEGWRALGLWRGMHARAVATGCTAYLLSLPGLLGLGLLWPWILKKLGVEFEPQALAEGFRTLPRERIGLVLLLGIAVVPLFEEILFRVFLQPLVQNFSEKGGVLLTSVLFGALHGESAFLPVFGLSLVLGAVMLRTQRLSAVWAVHAFHNALVFASIAVISGHPTREMTFFPRSGLMRPVPGGAFVAANAVVTGDVTFGHDVGVWFGCVLRGDDAPLTIGARTNVQDLTMIHADTGVPNTIGAGVTIGHRCVLHGARVEDGCLIGMGAILLGGSRIGAQSLIAAGAVVKEKFEVPPRSLVAGVPARIVRPLTDAEVGAIEKSAQGYVEKIRLYLDGRAV